MATVKNEPFYVTIELDVDSYDGDKNGEDSYQGISDSDLDKLGIDFRDDNVEIIHLTSSNFKDTLPGLDLFATLSGSNNGDSQQTIGLSAGLFCPVTVQWLLENFETKEGVSLPRSTVYNHYIAHCRLHEMEPVNAASFGKLIRSIFLGLQTRRLGTRGNSKYHYYGIQIKPESSLNSMTDFCGLEITDSEFENLRGPKKPAETITSGAYKAQKLRTSPQPCSSSQVNVPQEVVTEKVEIEGSPSKRNVPESESQDMVEMMSMLNVEPANTDTKELLKMNTKFPPITLRSKTMREWKKDIQLITAITTDTRRNNDLIQKVQLTAAKVASGCPKIDYRLASDIMGRSEVDQFRQGYQKLAQISVESCLMYNLDTFLLEHYKFWNGESSTMQSTSFTRAKLIVISQNECIRQYVLNVDSQVYDTVLTGLLPNNLDPLPVVVLDVLHNFVEKYLQTVSFSMEGFPDEMRNERMKSATAFLTAIRAHCELNMLADMVRPLFEELNRSKIQDALANMGVSSIKDLLSYRIDSLRRSFPNFNDLDAAARWIDGEADTALRQSKSQKEEKSLDLLARNFALDMSYLMHTILSITKFADSEVTSFLTHFAAFVDSYVLHLLERRKIVHRNSSLMQYLIAFLE